MRTSRQKHLIVFIGILWVLLFRLPAGAIEVETAAEFSTKTTTNEGRKWRIGYYEGGPYVNYPANLKAIGEGLVNLGWLDRRTMAGMDGASGAKAIWEILVNAQSPYLQFVSSAFWSANWDREVRTWNRAAATNQLRNGRLDFVIAMGTWAGQDLANHRHSVPTMVVSSSDPVKSGIIKSAVDSGIDHVHAKCDPNRYIRQIRLFHDITGFKRLGVVYENSMPGRSYAAIEDLETVAAQWNFSLVLCEAPWSGIAPQACTRNLIECHRKLAPKIDALFFTVHRGVDPNRMEEILAPLMAHKVPTWSQRGPGEVRQGVMISIVRGGFKAVGRYHAEIMAKIFNGAAPRKLNQIFEDPKRIAINLKTADEIGFTVPRGIMMVADEIYD